MKNDQSKRTEDPVGIAVDAASVSDMGRSDCVHIRQSQDAYLDELFARKVNRLSCRCSVCEGNVNDEYPVLISPSDAPLLNTAYDGKGGFLSSGTDMNWEMGLGDADGPASVSAWAPAPVYYNTAWTTSPFGNANWVGTDDSRYVHPYFRTRVNLGSSVDPSTFVLDLSFFSDDQVSEIYVNGVKQSMLPNGAGVIPGGGFKAEWGARILLDNNWRRCENEIIIHVWSMGGPPMGLLVQNAVMVEQDQDGCDCSKDCNEIGFPNVQPCITVKWGESACDCLETDDVELLCVAVCNCYSNVVFKDLTIGHIWITDMKGKPVPVLPDGTPSVQVMPSGPVSFGDIGPCKGKDESSCVSRELVLQTRGAAGGNYRLFFEGICYSVVREFQSEQCFVVKLCQD